MKNSYYLLSLFLSTSIFSQESDLFELSLEELLKIELEGEAVSHIDLFALPVTNNDSRLTNFSIPKSIEVISADSINARGLKNIIEVVDNMTGILVGESPSEPYSFSTRGFTRDSINVTYDGISMGVATYNTRPISTFNIQQVEFIKGPSELSIGQGGAGGTINLITKKAKQTSHHVKEVLTSVGEYGNSSLNLGLSGPVSQALMYRLDVSSNQSDGWVDNSSSHSTNVSASLLWLPSDEVELLFSLNHHDDELPAYWGTPFVTKEAALNEFGGVIKGLDGLTIDESMRFINYNVADNEIASDSMWTRVDAKWYQSNDVTFEATVYQFSADRNWQNSESYFYNSDINAVERDRLLVNHDRSNWGAVFKSHLKHNVIQLESETSVELSYHNIDFDRIVGFNLASPSLYWDSVDVFMPQAGEFGHVDYRQDYLTQSANNLVLTNNTSLTSELLLQTQIKYEAINFDRRYINWDGSVRERATIDTDFSDFSYFFGLSYKLSNNISMYGHFSQTHDPLFADYRFTYEVRNLERSSVNQIEVGSKARLNDNTEITAAVFLLEKSVNTQISKELDLFDSIQKSNGIEFSINSIFEDRINLAANIAFVDAKYEKFYDPEIGVQVDQNSPVNVPDTMINAAVSYLFETFPVEAGLKVNYVSSRWANSENSIELKDYAVSKVFAAYHGENYHVGIHLNNITDEIYGSWSDIYYPNQVILGAPQLLEITFKINF